MHAVVNVPQWGANVFNSKVAPVAGFSLPDSGEVCPVRQEYAILRAACRSDSGDGDEAGESAKVRQIRGTLYKLITTDADKFS
jgi:hypothetical protein